VADGGEAIHPKELVRGAQDGAVSDDQSKQCGGEDQRPRKSDHREAAGCRAADARREAGGEGRERTGRCDESCGVRREERTRVRAASASPFGDSAEKEQPRFARVLCARTLLAA
jgi:hypothetical protein